MSDNYFVKYKSRLQGPFTVSQLNKLMKKGKLTRSHLVSQDRKTWVALGEIEGVAKETITSQELKPAVVASPSVVQQDQSVSHGQPPVQPVPHATEETSEEITEEVQGPLSGGAVALRILGVICIIVGVLDFITANVGMYDMYSGLPFVYQIGVGNITLGFFTAIVLCGIGSYLLRAGKNALGTVAQDQKIMGIVAASWLVILAITNITVVGNITSYNEEVYLVMSGSLLDCPNRTLEEMAYSFMADPQWETVYGDDGNMYVNLTGGIMVGNREAVALIQFLITSSETFELQAVEYNGAPQSAFECNHLLDTMCSTY